jgi:NAD(P)-dependent dehydrogenase (short-subunit alcohol dehydrogenase family)
MKLAGKVLVVTGAGSGIARAVTLEAVRRVAKVAAVDLDAASLEETTILAAANGAVSTHVLNITDRTAVEALPGQVVARQGAVDGLVHCAGIIQPFAKLQDLDYRAIERVFAVNWWETLYLNKTFPAGAARAGRGAYRQCSEHGRVLPVPGQTVYGASC